MAVKTQSLTIRRVAGALGAEIGGVDLSRPLDEDLFAQVAKAFFGYLGNPNSLPAWEKSNMLAKYYICTKGVELSRGR